jgi:hypothetical protein
MSVWTAFTCSRLGPVAGSCEHGTEPSNSITGGKFLDQISEFSFSLRTHGVIYFLYGLFYGSTGSSDYIALCDSE